MKIGTRSVLYGAHCFFIHPWFVALAWTRLYGFPRDPRLWLAFFLHDLGYWGKPNMDGEEGEHHPEWAAKVMARLFDGGEIREAWKIAHGLGLEYLFEDFSIQVDDVELGYWGRFCLFHSRFYCKRYGRPYSRLCVADKLSFSLTPRWLYLPMVIATGEIHEYMRLAEERTAAGEPRYAAQGQHLGSRTRWWIQVATYMSKWAYEHADLRPDTWTPDMGERRAADASGAWQ